MRMFFESKILEAWRKDGRLLFRGYGLRTEGGAGNVENPVEMTDMYYGKRAFHATAEMRRLMAGEPSFSRLVMLNPERGGVVS